MGKIVKKRCVDKPGEVEMEQLAYKEFFESTPCYLTVQDRDLNIIAANQRFKEQFGAIEGRRCYQIYKHRSEKCEQCPVLRTFHDGEGHRSEERVCNLKGQELSVIVFTTPVFDDQGGVKAVMEMSTDITEIKQLQEQLRQSQERYRLIFDEVPCYISIQDKNLRILEANRRFKESFGTSLGHHCYQIYKHRNEECFPCAVKKTFEDGQEHHSEEVVTSLDGKQINTLVYTAPLHDKAGQIQSVMEMSTNITPIRELQSQLESIGLLISSISHGIKGLLTGLNGGVYLVNSGLKKDDRGRIDTGWEMVQRNVDRIRDMVLNILYYAKERQPNWESISLEALTQELIAIIEPRAQKHQIELVLEHDPKADFFEADRQAIRSLLINLLENSVDACRVDQKKAEHRITLSTKEDAHFIHFEIQDNGIGMDQETKEKAFNLFFSSKGSEGTGLGLFIANKIATAHGGKIQIDSEPNRGTHFIISLPRQRQ